MANRKILGRDAAGNTVDIEVTGTGVVGEPPPADVPHGAVVLWPHEAAPPGWRLVLAKNGKPERLGGHNLIEKVT